MCLPLPGRQAQYLLGALQRLGEGVPSPPAGSVPLQPDSPPRVLHSAEVIVLGGQLGAHLAPLLTQPYVVRRHRPWQGTPQDAPEKKRRVPAAAGR